VIAKPWKKPQNPSTGEWSKKKKISSLWAVLEGTLGSSWEEHGELSEVVHALDHLNYPPAFILCRAFSRHSLLSAGGWLPTMILWISGSWVARITGMSHWCPAGLIRLCKVLCHPAQWERSFLPRAELSACCKGNLWSQWLSVEVFP
jgi:hypothetical protein